MAFNGSGTYNLPAGNPVVTGTTISSTTTNNTNSDIATALTNCITRDGQSTPSANLPMNAKKLTGLAAGTSAGDSVRYEQVLLLTGGTLTGNLTITGANSLRGSYGSGNQSTNFAAGDGSLTSNTTGINNTATGYQALYLNTTGDSNTANGMSALYSNTTGSSNTASGVGALTSNTTGISNTASGVNALGSNITGGSNTAIGANALVYNTTGSNNTASGEQALYSNTTGINNTASGVNALVSNTTGRDNVAVGKSALATNTTAGYTTAIGSSALASNTIGTSNSAFGYAALQSNINGSFNTALGYSAISQNTTGFYNSAVGSEALVSNTTGSYNTAIGYLALGSNSTGSGNTAINSYTAAGVYAPVFDPSTQNNRFCMGSTGVTNAYIQVAWTVVSDARDKTNFAPVPHGLDFVNKLSPTAYQFKESRETDVPTGIVRYGFKAQDILALEGDTPVIIDNENPDKLRFNSDSLVPVLVNAIKELTARLEILENKGV